MKARYDLTDLYALGRKEITCKEMAEKYNTKVENIYKAMKRHHIRVGKRAIRITTKYGSKVVYGMPECADELKISVSSVNNALHGKQVRQLEELEIKVEYV